MSLDNMTQDIFNDSMHNYGQAGRDLAQAGEGLWNVVQGVWDAGTGAFGAAGRAIWGTVELGGAALTFLPELAIDGINGAVDDAIDNAVEARVSPQCRVDSEGRVTAESVGAVAGAAAARGAQRGAERSSNSYTVQAGDSLWRIAANDYRQNHGGEVDNRAVVAMVEQLKARYGETIHPGMEIIIPRDRQGA